MKTSRVTAWRRPVRAKNRGWGPYRFAAIIAAFTAVVYALSYLNVFESTHIEFSQMRLWRSLIVGSALALALLLVAGSLWRSGSSRFGMIAIALAAMLPAFWLLRSQRTIDDVAYLKSMIPNHSIAVLASSRAHIRDQRVRQLADEILARQLHEIDAMKRLIATIDGETSVQMRLEAAAPGPALVTAASGASRTRER